MACQAAGTHTADKPERDQQETPHAPDQAQHFFLRGKKDLDGTGDPQD